MFVYADMQVLVHVLISEQTAVPGKPMLEYQINYMEITMNKLLTLLGAGLMTVAIHMPVQAADAAKADSKAAEATAEGNYKAAKAKIQSDEKAAKAECEKLSGKEQSACKKDASHKEDMASKEAKATYKKAMVDAKAMK